MRSASTQGAVCTGAAATLTLGGLLGGQLDLGGVSATGYGWLAGIAVVSTVGAVGFCMGGGFVLLLAAQQDGRVSAAVPYYGVGPAVPKTFEGLTAAVQGHYGERDDFYPADDARAQAEQIRRESGAEVEFHFYDAGHAFHNDTDKLGTYSPADAATAWTRTVEFLRAKVV